MAFLYCVDLGRDLVEGDEVEYLPTGEVGTVVGFRYTSDLPIVLDLNGQRTVASASLVRPVMGESPEALEPLPDIHRLLNEGDLHLGGVVPIGAVGLVDRVSGTTITLLPANNSTNLPEVMASLPFKEAVKSLLELSIVSRLPHLVN